jgi:hypothetical protein
MLANQAGTPEIKDQLAKEALGVRGFSGEETLAAMSGFVTKTGDLTAARGAIQGLADLSLATGTDFGEMGEAAGQAFNVIRDTIKDPKEQLAALAEVMSTIAGQGNLGAVEIRDMATELAGLGAATRSFKGGPVELLKSMGAIAQASVARGGAKDAAEATTAVTRFAADVTKRPAQKALKGLGIDVFADKGKTQLKDPREIMADILAKTGGDMTQIEEVLNVESAKALRGFSPLFLEAERNRKATGQGPTGKEALFAEFQRFTGANLSPEEIQKRAASRLEDPDLQFSEAAKQFNEAVSKDLLPALTKLVPEFVKLTPALGDLFNAIARLLRLLPGQEVDPSTLPPEEAAMVKSARNTSLLEEVGHGLTFNLLRDKPSSFGLPSWLDGDDKPKLSPPGLPVPETPTRQAAPVTQEANKELAAFTSEVSKARKELAGFKVPASPDASRTAPIISPARN